MSGDHYRTLGVDPSASMADIRGAYVDLVRRHHPDHAEDDVARDIAEERMRDLNAAWSALGTPEARSDYDRERVVRSPGPASRPRHARGFADGEWQPYDIDDGPTFDDLYDDTPITDGGLPSWLTLAPAALLFAGIALLVVGGFVGILPFVAAGFAALLLSAGMFLIAPIVAMATSRRGDPDA